MTRLDTQTIVDDNFRAFEENMLPSLLEKHRGKYALIHDKALVEIFDSMKDALLFARETFSDDLYSVQKVTNVPIQLIGYSYALPDPSVRPPDRAGG